MGRTVQYITTSRKKDRIAETSKDLTVIIPTAGVGYRMRSYGPHALLSYEGQPLLQKQILSIKKTLPNADIVVTVGYEATKIMYNVGGVRFVENENYETTNTLRSIAMGMRVSLTDRVMVIYGDILFSPEILQFSDNESWVVGDNRLKNTSVGLVVNNSHVVNFAYDLDTKWGKIVHLCDNELKIFKKIAYDNNNKKLLGYEGLNALIEKGGKLKCNMIGPKHRIYEIDSYKDLQNTEL